jgi:hypothetical protein
MAGELHQVGRDFDGAEDGEPSGQALVSPQD